MNLFKKLKKLGHTHRLQVVGLCAGVTVLILAAVFISIGGMSRVSTLLTFNNISPSSLTANIFPCSWFADCSYSTQTTYGLTSNTTSVAPGAPVTLTWYAYSQTFSSPTGSCIQGTYYPVSSACSLTGVGAVGATCVATPPSSSESCTYDSYGRPTCTTTYYAGNSCSSLSGNPSTGSATVYPNTTTTYSFCASNYYATRDGSNFGWFPYPAPCPSVTVAVTAPAPTCTLTPATQTVTLPGTPSVGYTTTNSPTSVTYSVDGVAKGAAPASPFVPSGATTGGAHTVVLTVSNSSGSATCGTANNVMVNAQPGLSADATAPSSIPLGQVNGATISFHADSATPPTSCIIKNYNDTATLYTVAGCPTSANTTWQTGTTMANTPGSYAYKFYVVQAGNTIFVKTVTINVSPICTLSASPSRVASGGTATLTYTTTGANSASINNGVAAIAPVAGTPVKWASGPGSGSFSLPANAVINRIDAVGGGGAGTLGYGGGGGGGAYEQALTPPNFPSGTSFTYYVGAAGVANGGNGGYTGILNSTGNWAVLAYGGSGGVYGGAGVGVGGAGGIPYSIAGVTGYYGGNGGNGAYGGGGGGGAAGPSGRGGNGGSYAGGNYSGGGGGGGANAGSAGGNNDSVSPPDAGGRGGNDGWSGGPGGTPYPYYANCSGGASSGGGGPGGTANACGGGAASSDLSLGSWGVGGGGGGGGGGPVGVNGGGRPGAPGAYYGGGGGAGGAGSYGGDGAGGILVITYTPYTFAASGSATTPPITTTPTTFTMTVTDSASGLTGQCSVPVTISDVCGDISGFQSVAPASPCLNSVTQGGQCIPNGYVWNGSACIISPPQAVSIINFFGPSRVRKGNIASLNYALINPSGTCRITGTNGYDSGSFTALASGAKTSTPISANTRFTLTCGTMSLSTTVGITPSFQEQ